MTAPTPTPARALVTLGGIPLYGQERGNIQVFHALDSVGVDALFVTHATYGHESIQPALDRLGLAWTTAPYPRRWGRGLSLGQIASRLRDVRGASRAFVEAARAYRPTHIHTMSERYFLDLYPAIRRLSLPVVYRAGDEPRTHHPLYRMAWRRLIIPGVHQFIANSQFIRRSLLNAGVPADKVRVIYTYPPDRPPRDGTDLPDDVLQPFDGRTVVYMGQISQDKGVDLLVDAALRLCGERDDLRFLLAGNVSWKNPFAESLMAKVEQAGLEDRIRFLGFVDDVTRLLDLADVHAAPSVWAEPLANTVLEAKRAGVPSVVFASGGLPELAVDQGRDTFVCEAKTSDALTAGLRHYLDLDADALADASAAASASMEALGITREAFTQAWADVYTSSPS